MITCKQCQKEKDETKFNNSATCKTCKMKEYRAKKKVDQSTTNRQDQSTNKVNQSTKPIYKPVPVSLPIAPTAPTMATMPKAPGPTGSTNTQRMTMQDLLDRNHEALQLLRQLKV